MNNVEMHFNVLFEAVQGLTWGITMVICIISMVIINGSVDDEK